MRAVVQRIDECRIEVGGRAVGSVGKGLLVYLGIGRDDTESAADYIVQKLSGLRVFEDTQGLMEIYETIDRLEKTEVKVRHFAEYNELYPYLLLPAFVLLSLWIVFSNTRFLKIP